MLTLIMQSFLLVAIGQQQGLKMGESVPSLTIQAFQGGKPTNLRLSDLKGKLVILDFWGLNCAPCIAAFPKMDSLQKEYGDKLKIILVTPHSKSQVDQFFRIRKHLKYPVLPMVFNDTTLRSFFPHDGYPFHTWIDEQGNLFARSSGSETTRENLNNFFAKKTVALVEKKKALNINWNYPYVADSAKAGYLKGYSFLLPFADSLGAVQMLLTTPSGAINRFVCNGCAAVSLILSAYNEGRSYYNFSRNLNNVIIDLADTSSFDHPKDGSKNAAWAHKYAWFYDFMVPEERAAQMYAAMRNDLNNYFPLTARKEKRIIRQLALIRTNTEDKFKSKGGETKTMYRLPPHDTSWVIFNLQMDAFVKRVETIFNDKNYPYRVKNLTGYKGNIDMSLSASAFDTLNIDAARKELLKYGLTLVEMDLEDDVLIITDKPEKTDDKITKQ